MAGSVPTDRGFRWIYRFEVLPLDMSSTEALDLLQRMRWISTGSIDTVELTTLLTSRSALCLLESKLVRPLPCPVLPIQTNHLSIVEPG